MKNQSGFTFIETLITIAILASLTGILLLYNRGGERQIILLREKAKLIGTLLKAKSLSINTLITDEPICGYGIHFAQNYYLIFKDRGTDCLASDKIFTTNDPQELVEQINLSTGISFGSLDVHDILFLPPNPIMFFDGQDRNGETIINLTTADGKSSVNFRLNNAGQISQ